MISVRLIGGLGNQMFQYALGRRLAHDLKTDLTLDTSWFGTKDPTGAAVRSYELDCFNLNAALSTKPLADYEPAGYLSRIQRKLGLSNRRLITEPGDGFHPALLHAADGSILNGWWQNERYFAEIAPFIRQDFSFGPEPSRPNRDLAREIDSDQAVSLHVRRGDYVESAITNAHHGTSTLEYYNAAIAKITKSVGKPHFFVFSDDPAWTKKNIKSKHQMTYVDFNPPDKGYEDMRLMSQCQHHIIANSSFSWWGAWLNPNPEKIVIAPQQWLKDPAANAKHELPAKWIRL